MRPIATDVLAYSTVSLSETGLAKTDESIEMLFGKHVTGGPRK